MDITVCLTITATVPGPHHNEVQLFILHPLLLNSLYHGPQATHQLHLGYRYASVTPPSLLNLY
jgi:hypothetical protein